MKLTLSSAAEFMQATGKFDPAAVAAGYSIDSRTLRPGDLFFAVRGERLDGHEFVEAALAKGAVGAVVGKDQQARFAQRYHLLEVEDPLLALQRLAGAVRRLWGKPLIAITGSAGKTTTKEAIAHVLGTTHRVLKSQGNLNNHFGMPLQLLRLEPEHEIAVVEMGMSHPGEITALAKLAEPNCGVVTMVAPVHLEFFASIAAIARAKYELIQSLPAGSIAVLNADDEYVSQFGQDFHGKVVTFGLQKPAEVSARKIESHGRLGSVFEIVVEDEHVPAALPLLGEHSIYNALAAIAVGLQYGVPLCLAAASLATLAPGDKRGEILNYAGATIINDCYNSNPKALDNMVRSLAQISARRRIVVAGEMLELGPAAQVMHRDCGQHMAQYGIDRLLGVRGLAKSMVEGALAAGIDAEFVSTPEEAGAWLQREVRTGDAVLLKASRGVRLELALEVLDWQNTGRCALETSSKISVFACTVVRARLTSGKKNRFRLLRTVISTIEARSFARGVRGAKAPHYLYPRDYINCGTARELQLLHDFQNGEEFALLVVVPEGFSCLSYRPVPNLSLFDFPYHVCQPYCAVHWPHHWPRGGPPPA